MKKISVSFRQEDLSYIMQGLSVGLLEHEKSLVEARERGDGAGLLEIDQRRIEAQKRAINILQKKCYQQN